MPFKSVHVEPEVFMQHKGITIYHVYSDDDVDCGKRDWCFGYREDCTDDGFGTFDVEKLPDYDDACDTDEQVQAVIRKAVDAGILTQDGLKE